MPKVAALVDAHSLCAFVVIPKACSSLGLVHPATTTFSFLFLVFFSCSVPVLFSLLLRLLLLRGCHRVACHFDAAVFFKINAAPKVGIPAVVAMACRACIRRGVCLLTCHGSFILSWWLGVFSYWVSLLHGNKLRK